MKKEQAKKKERLDRLLIEKGLAASREKARALIMAGRVWVEGDRIDKAGKEVDKYSEVTLKGALPYVSRGGIKLAGALKHFSFKVCDKVAMDVGASTGGFTDCLLKEGAKKVYAVDVGYGQLDWSLRRDRRVILIERKNVRYLTLNNLGEMVDLSVIDVSFISLEKVIPPVVECVKRSGNILALLKPQFEVGKGEVGKGGIVRDTEKHKKVIDKIAEFSIGLGLKIKGVEESPIKGAKGNREFWIYLGVL
ncbi:MAG: TlyA family RNA methyltransferase [Thermodesulfobacteriota bacterium]